MSERSKDTSHSPSGQENSPVDAESKPSTEEQTERLGDPSVDSETFQNVGNAVIEDYIAKNRP